MLFWLYILTSLALNASIVWLATDRPLLAAGAAPLLEVCALLLRRKPLVAERLLLLTTVLALGAFYFLRVRS
jgi:hypothetical protein